MSDYPRMMDHATKMRKLAGLYNYHTRYEVVLTRGDQTFLVCYSGRKSLSGLRHCAVDAIKDLVFVIGLEEIEIFSKKAKPQPCLVLNDGWTMRFSGRTQRDCYCNGEWLYLPSPPKVDAPSMPTSARPTFAEPLQDVIL